jgi:hypothetical protein
LLHWDPTCFFRVLFNSLALFLLIN